MFTTSSIIDKLKQEEVIDYKKLCRLLKISKKSDKEKLDIALKALEELDIIDKNKENGYSNSKESNHIVAKIRCSSKGYCFAVRERNKEDIYIRENLLNCAWNGDKVLVRIIKEGVRRRSPEGIVDCILERRNEILLAKVEILDGEVYAIPIDDRILSKIKLPKEDERYEYILEKKNIVKVKIDLFPIAQYEGIGHVTEELNLHNNEKHDTEFVLSKSNIFNLTSSKEPNKAREIKEKNRIDLTKKNAYMFKGWLSKNSPLIPLIHLDQNDDKSINLWVHTNAIAERLDFSSKNVLEIFFNRFESFPLLDQWQNYLSSEIINTSDFKIGENNEAISVCINLNSDFEIINWSFHLTIVKCSLIVDNKHLNALLSRKSKKIITSRILKPIKQYVDDLDNILEVSKMLRNNQIKSGKIEIAKPQNNIESLNEFYVCNPGDFSKEYFEPLNKDDIHTYLYPLLYEANLIWFQHSKNYKLQNASYISQELDYINVSDMIKNSELADSNIELNDNGTLTFNQLLELCKDDNKRKILNKLLRNILRDNELLLISKDLNINDLDRAIVSPWTMPSFDFINLINQYNLYNMIVNGKRCNKGSSKEIEIMKKDSWQNVNWEIYNTTTSKNLNLYFNNFLIEKFNEYKNKAKQYKFNMINIKQVRKAEKLIGNVYDGIIMTVQSYGFFVEISELNVEGLVHVSTLNNDWYEYRSRQNLLIGRKSKRSYKIGDKIDIKIIKVDILKYQIDLELVEKE